MSKFIKIGESRLKQCPNQNNNNGSLKEYHRFWENM
jgi:hypothetical protein